ncbi:MAG: helix-turn-helix transcriptional regulator [Arenicella sp.]|jgi:transcriptional regulator with XRE-family HTH domain|nr:helix-turn-helix transcriptional regulator [Arenicella sp.]
MPKYGADEQKILKAFGAKLKVARVRLGLSQERLAEHCGLHRTYVASAERGERNVSLLNLSKIAHGLGIQSSDLLD